MIMVNYMATDVMLQLGSYQFSVDTAAYQELKRSTEYRWKAQERIGQIDALQFTGVGADTITLTGVIFTAYKGGAKQVDAMRTEAAKGNALILVDGIGFVHGRWVIEKIEETQDAFVVAGIPRKQQFTLQIKRYSDGV